MRMQNFSRLVAVSAVSLGAVLMTGCATGPNQAQGHYNQNAPAPRVVYSADVISNPGYNPANRVQHQQYYNPNSGFVGQPQANPNAVGVRSFGALSMGILGNQVGKPGSNDRTAATAALALTGYMVGDNLTNPCAPGVTTQNIIGAVVGGAAGSFIGGGKGRDAAAALMAIQGYNVGNSIAPRRPGC